METKRLYRSKDDRWIGGVCGGIGEYFGIDPIIIRLLFLLAFLGWGAGLLIYLLMWIIVPENKEDQWIERLEKSTPSFYSCIFKRIDNLSLKPLYPLEILYLQSDF